MLSPNGVAFMYKDPPPSYCCEQSQYLFTSSKDLAEAAMTTEVTTTGKFILNARSSHPSEARRIQGPVISTWILALIAVCARFAARKMSKAGLWYDDWLIIPTMVC